MPRLICSRRVRLSVQMAAAFLALASPGWISPVQAASTLNFPRLSFEPNTLTGIAIVNPSSQDAMVTMTAYGADGRLLAGSGFQNPVQKTIPPNQQFSRLTTELFGNLDPSNIGWFQVTSSVDGLTGFFLFLNVPRITLFDGADLPESAIKIIFNRVRVDSGFSTEIDLINPGGGSSDVELQLVGPDSSRLNEKTVTLPAKGVLRLDVASLFEVSAVPDGSYVSASADAEIAGFEFVKSANGDLLGLNARNASEQLTTLYFPQMAVLGPWKTELGLINYSAQPAILTVSAYKPDGTLYGAANLKNNPVTRSLESGRSLREDVETMFGFSGPDALDGWIKVESTAAAVNGYVSYGIPSAGSVAAVASAATARGKALFSHIATTQDYYTGVAILNPGSLAANIRIMALRPDGQVLGSFDTVLLPRQRISKLIDQYIPVAAGQSGGIIWVSSDVPVYLTSLFGSTAILANIPPQAAPDSYRPDAGRLTLRLSPSLVSLTAGSAQSFSVQGGSGAFVWKVNGIAGGNATLGTINSAGTYRAPNAVPSPLPVTVSAEQDTLAAGASIDIQQKSSVLSGLGLVQSVVYLSSLKKLYSTELSALAAAKPLLVPSFAEATTNSTVFEVSPSSAKTSVATYNNETITKTVAFSASDGKEYMLLAGKSSGRIIRLNPDTRDSRDVVTGLNQPTALVMDPVSGNLLVAEQSGISIIARTTLETGLVSAAKPNPPNSQEKEVLFSALGVSGVAVDSCTGKIYFSDSIGGRIAVYDRGTGQITTVVSGLQNPGQLLAVYRSEVSCPDSLQIFAVERRANRILLLLPKNGSVSTWLQSPVPIDVIFLPKDNPFAFTEAIMVATNDEVSIGQIIIIPISANPGGAASSGAPSGLYSDFPVNSPAGTGERGELAGTRGSLDTPAGSGPSTCFAVVSFADPDLETAVRRALGIGLTTPITCEMARSLRFLDARNFRKSASAEVPPIITSLRGLEAFRNLSGLILSANLVRDLRPITRLYPLTELNLEGNAISDIGPLSRLTRLKKLNLTSNPLGSARVFGPPLQGLVDNYGLGPGDTVDLTATRLTIEDCPDLLKLISRGIAVSHDVSCANTTDLSITKSASPEPVVAGNNLIYAVVVTNNGPAPATGITMTDSLPAGVSFVLATSTVGGCSQASGTVKCAIGNLSGGAAATVTIIVTASATGTITNTATVTGNETDSNTANNTARVSTTVNALGVADLSISKSAAPDPVTVGNRLNYSIVVTNKGPSGTSGVTMTDALPGGASFVSATSTQGSCSQASGTVTCNIGVLASNSSGTVTIVVTPLSTGTISNTASVKGNETDPDNANNTARTSTVVNPPTVSFAAAASNGLEAVTSPSISVVLSQASSAPVTVNYTVTGGSATGGGVDFSLPNGTLTFAPGETTKSISFSVVDDALDEPDETIVVALSSPTNAILGSPDTHTYTIIDNDGTPRVAFNTTASSGSESTTPANLAVALSNPSGQTVTVNYAVTGGTATNGTDYSLPGGTLSFAPGETTKNISVSIIDDAMDEPDETIIVTLSSPFNAGLGPNTTHTYTILDNDPPPSVAFAAASSSGSESVTPANLNVVLSAASGLTVTVDYAVSGGSATGGGVDYTLNSGTLTFAPGETSKVIPISVVNDNIDEPNETIMVSLSSPINATLGSIARHTYTILDDDPTPTVAFASASSSGSESITSVALTVTLSNPSSSTVTVNYANTGGTANGPTSTFNVDHNLSSGTLTFNPGETSKNITFTVFDDSRDEPDETVIVTLSSPTNAVLGSITTHTYTILDNDPPPTVSFSTSSATSGLESVASPSIVVTLSGLSDKSPTVNYAATGGTATGGGVDYTLAPGTRTFGPAQSSATIPLSIVNDLIDEPNETVVISLSSPTNATLATPSTHTYTILDDDLPPDLSITKTGPGTTVALNNNFNYTLTARNFGPSTATAVVVTDTLPSGVTYQSAVPAAANCIHTGGNPGGTVTCTLGTMTNVAIVTITITVKATSAGTWPNSVTINGAQSDPNTANDSDLIRTTIQ